MKLESIMFISDEILGFNWATIVIDGPDSDGPEWIAKIKIRVPKTMGDMQTIEAYAFNKAREILK